MGMPEEFRYEKAWLLNNEKIASEAIALWSEFNILPRNVNPADRARELITVAYDGDRMVGVTTGEVTYYEPVRQKFVFMRIFIHPDYEKGGVSVPLTIAAREDLRQWSIDNPNLKIAGYGAVITAPGYGEKPYLPAGLYPVGYTPDGHQIRLYWFEHFRLPLTMPAIPPGLHR